jgi:phosphoglycerate dehydrogenase-like enzyme
MTSHSAFSTRERLERMLDTICRTIDAFARGKPEDVVS